MCRSRRSWGELPAKRDFHFHKEGSAPHPDYGCNAESYRNDGFIEVETVGPLTHLTPGQAATHVERWELHAAPTVPRRPRRACAS
jgi:hypothetical protein